MSLSYVSFVCPFPGILCRLFLSLSLFPSRAFLREPFIVPFSRIFARAFHCSVLAHPCASRSFRLMLGFRVYIVHFSRIFARAFHHPFLAHPCASLSLFRSRAFLREPFIIHFSRIFARAFHCSVLAHFCASFRRSRLYHALFPPAGVRFSPVILHIQARRLISGYDAGGCLCGN